MFNRTNTTNSSTTSIPTPIWDTLTKKNNVHFDLQQNDTSNLHNDAFNSSIPGYKQSNVKTDEFKCKNSVYHPSQLSPLLSVSQNNNIDLAQLLITQYQSSNLQYNEFIKRSCLLNELRTSLKTDQNAYHHHYPISSPKQTALNMFENYILAHNKYICKSLPLSSDDISNTFVPYDDRIDIVLQYMMQFNRINRDNIIKVKPTQLDIYFVPPNAANNFESLYMDGMAYSGPDSRYRNRSGLDDIYGLFCSQTCQKLMRELQKGTTRLILLIVRGNEYNTNEDILYLFTKNISSNLRDVQYENNETLWNLNSQKDRICNTSFADLFNISYHFHKNNAIRIYMYYNGFGERILKRNMVHKLPFIFTSINSKNRVSNQILKEFYADYGFDDCIHTDKMYEFGTYLFGLNYQRKRFTDHKLKLLLNIPKAVVRNDTTQIREFNDPQNQLYYYLTWTCKMQVIDGEFSEYTLRDKQYNEIAIFNSELHEKYSNDVLYVICTRNNQNNYDKPKWNMHQLMTPYQIYKTYGIYSTDLPIGSRFIHSYFQQEMTQNNLNLCPEIISVQNWNKVRIILSQKYTGNSKPNFNRCDLNNHIIKSIHAIRSNQNNLSLIPILRIDANQKRIRCEPLIPIQLPNKNIAVSYKTLNNKIVINALYIDPIDIINKAALVDAHAVNTYKYLLNGDDVAKPDRVLLGQSRSVDSNTSRNSTCVQSVTYEAWTINALQIQLREALQRENLMLSMIANQNTNQNEMKSNNSPSRPRYICNFSQINLPSPNNSIHSTPNIQLQLPSPYNIHSTTSVGNISPQFSPQNYFCNPIIRPNPTTFPSLPTSPIIHTQIQCNNLPLLTQTMDSPACIRKNTSNQ